MRYIVLGVLAGLIAGYTVEAFFPFKSAWGALAIVSCVVIGAIAQCYDCKKRAIQKTDRTEPE